MTESLLHETNQSHVIIRKITAADDGNEIQAFEGIPANSIVLEAGLIIKTAFDGTSPVFDVGHATDPNSFGTAVVAASVGKKVGDEMATTADAFTDVELIPSVTFSTTGNDSTVGVGYAYWVFMPVLNEMND